MKDNVREFKVADDRNTKEAYEALAEQANDAILNKKPCLLFTAEKPKEDEHFSFQLAGVKVDDKILQAIFLTLATEPGVQKAVNDLVNRKMHEKKVVQSMIRDLEKMADDLMKKRRRGPVRRFFAKLFD